MSTGYVPSGFRGHPHPCGRLSRRYPGLHPGGREQAEGHGGELPHLAASSDEAHQGGGEGQRSRMDYHHLALQAKLKAFALTIIFALGKIKR